MDPQALALSWRSCAIGRWVAFALGLDTDDALSSLYVLARFRVTRRYIFTLLLSNKQRIWSGQFHLGGTLRTYSCLVPDHPGWSCWSYFMCLVGKNFITGHYIHGLRTIPTLIILSCLLPPRIPCILCNSHVWFVVLVYAYLRRKIKKIRTTKLNVMSSLNVPPNHHKQAYLSISHSLYISFSLSIYFLIHFFLSRSFALSLSLYIYISSLFIIIQILIHLSPHLVFQIYVYTLLTKS